MKIAYLVEWDAFHDSGVARKINAQIKGWGSLGNDVRLIVVSPSPEGNFAHVFDGGDTTVLMHAVGGGLGKIAKAWALRRAKALIEEFGPDVITTDSRHGRPG